MERLGENAHSAALRFMHYNFVKIDAENDPTQAAGVTDWLWEIEDLVTLLEG